MLPEGTHLYKMKYQQPIEKETLPHKGKSKTAATSNSRKRSNHKHIYKKIILHYGSSTTFAWGRQCEICGRVDSTYKASNWCPKEFLVTCKELDRGWRRMSINEIHRKYPEYAIMELKNAEWVEWTGENI